MAEPKDKDSRVRGVSKENQEIKDIPNLDFPKSKNQGISDEMPAPVDDVFAQIDEAVQKTAETLPPNFTVESDVKVARVSEKVSRPMAHRPDDLAGFRIIDDSQKRVLAKELQKIEYVHRTLERDVTSNWQRNVDMWAFVDMLKLFNDVCRNEYNRNVDFKSLGIKGKGHGLTDENLDALAKALIGMFGPHWILNQESRDEFFNFLTARAEGALDPEWREAGMG